MIFTILPYLIYYHNKVLLFYCRANQIVRCYQLEPIRRLRSVFSSEPISSEPINQSIRRRGGFLKFHSRGLCSESSSVTSATRGRGPCVCVCNSFGVCVCVQFYLVSTICVCVQFTFYFRFVCMCNHFGACVFVLCVLACVCNFGLCV